MNLCLFFCLFFQAEDGIRDHCVTGVQTCALTISHQVEASLHELLEQRGVQALRLDAGQRIHFSKTSFDVLAAPGGQDSSADADSIPSIALRISGTAGSILL